MEGVIKATPRPSYPVPIYPKQYQTFIILYFIAICCFWAEKFNPVKKQNAVKEITYVAISFTVR